LPTVSSLLLMILVKLVVIKLAFTYIRMPGNWHLILQEKKDLTKTALSQLDGKMISKPTADSFTMALEQGMSID